MAVSKKARRLRIRISQLGILQKVEEAEMKQQMERHATAVQVSISAPALTGASIDQPV